jgi:hypothetical protein
VPGAPVAAIEVLGVNSVQLPHPPPQIRIGRFDQQVVVVPHQAEGMTDPPKFFDNGGEYLKKTVPIPVIFKNPAPSIAARGHVVNSA